MANGNNANIGFEKEFGKQLVSFGDTFLRQNTERLS